MPRGLDYAYKYEAPLVPVSHVLATPRFLLCRVGGFPLQYTLNGAVQFLWFFFAVSCGVFSTTLRLSKLHAYMRGIRIQRTKYR